jgi:hypothetical protein
MNIDGQCHCGLVTYQAETGDNGRTRFQHFCRNAVPRCSPAARRARRLGNPLGQHPPARPARARAADLVQRRRAMDHDLESLPGRPTD